MRVGDPSTTQTLPVLECKGRQIGLGGGNTGGDHTDEEEEEGGGGPANDQQRKLTSWVDLALRTESLTKINMYMNTAPRGGGGGLTLAPVPGGNPTWGREEEGESWGGFR